jgi:hypothetical protein
MAIKLKEKKKKQSLLVRLFLLFKKLSKRKATLSEKLYSGVIK